HQFRGVAASHALQFAGRHVVRIANNSALGPAEWNVDDRTLPSHPAGEGADFVKSHIRRVTYAAFGRSAGNGVLDAEAGEYFQAAIVHRNRYVNDQLTIGITQDLYQALIKIQLLRSSVETGGLSLPRINF